MGAQECKGQHGQKGPCPRPRGLSPKPAGARRGCPGAPGPVHASDPSSRDSGKRTHDCSKLDSPTAPRTPSPAAPGLESPQRGTSIREREQEEGHSAPRFPVAQPRDRKAQAARPSGPPDSLSPFCWGEGPRSCPLTPGELRETPTLERGSQRARDQVPTPAWGQAITDRAASCCPEDHSLAEEALRERTLQGGGTLCTALPSPWAQNQHLPGDTVPSHYPRLLPREGQALGPGHSSCLASPVQPASPRLGPHCTQRAHGPVLRWPVFNRGAGKPGSREDGEAAEGTVRAGVTPGLGHQALLV